MNFAEKIRQILEKIEEMIRTCELDDDGKRLNCAHCYVYLRPSFGYGRQIRTKVNFSSTDPSANQRPSKITPIPHLPFLSTAIISHLPLPVIPALLSRRSLVICVPRCVRLPIVLYPLYTFISLEFSTTIRCHGPGITSPFPRM